MTVRSFFVVLCLSALFLLMFGGVQQGLPADSAQSSPISGTPASIPAAYKNLPLAFEPNQGQTDFHVRFLSRGHGYSLFLTDDEAVLKFKRPGKPRSIGQQKIGSVLPSTGLVRMKLVNASVDRDVTGLEELPGNSNYFVGNDPAKWHRGVPNFARVKYRNVYPGVDLVYYGNQGQLEYDFIVKAGANPDNIRLNISGVDGESGEKTFPHLDSTGELVAETRAGEVHLHKPVMYQLLDNGQARHIDGHFRLRGSDEVGFEIGAYDRTRELVIDPVLIYSSYLGGSNGDAVNSVSVAFDSAGNAYVASGTMSTDFPVVSAAQPGYGGQPAICDQGDNFCGDAFVTKINAAGTAILYSTYLGGSDTDYAFGLAVDSAGNAYVTGQTKSTNFPVTAGAFQPVYGGAPSVCDDYDCGDVFVTKLNPTGNGLVYSSYLGGSGNDHSEAIVVDGAGNAYVTGDTGSSNFPISPGAFQTQFTGSNSCYGRSGAFVTCHVAFVTKVNASGTLLVYSTYLGGSSGDNGAGITVDSLGRAAASGNTCSGNFPVTASAYQRVAVGGCDVFLTKLNATGTHLLYSTYFGGTGYDASYAQAIDGSGNIYLSGFTYSSDFPTTGSAFQNVLAGSDDAFVAKFNPTLIGAASLIYSTYLGGTQSDLGAGVAVDTQGNAYTVGQTNSPDFPLANPLQSALNGKYDAFITKLNPQGSALLYSTYLGGSGTELADYVMADSSGNAYVAGWTQSADFPSTPRAFQPSYAGSNTDVFITKVGPNSAAGVSFTPATLTFPAQAVGSTSAAQTVVLHNVGSAPLSIAGMVVSTGFAETNNCSKVAGGGSCAISITFSPTTVGVQNGIVGVADNAGGSPQKIRLTGSGK